MLVFRQRLDSRATFVLGGSISLALGARTYGMTSVTSDGTGWVGLITGSMVTVGVLTAVGLSLLFRIGQRRRRRSSLHVGGDDAAAVGSAQVGRVVDELVDDTAGDGPRRTCSAIVAEVIRRGLADRDVEARVSTDDLRLRVDLTYDGRPLDVDPRRPLDADDLTDENVFAASMARYLDVPRPDDLKVTTHGRGSTWSSPTTWSEPRRAGVGQTPGRGARRRGGWWPSASSWSRWSSSMPSTPCWPPTSRPVGWSPSTALLRDYRGGSSRGVCRRVGDDAPARAVPSPCTARRRSSVCSCAGPRRPSAGGAWCGGACPTASSRAAPPASATPSTTPASVYFSIGFGDLLPAPASPSCSHRWPRPWAGWGRSAW